MPWFRIDDSFYDHPKVFDAPDCAVALWVRAGTWSARNLTDGFVPSALLARFCSDPETAAAELVRRRLWSKTRGGYRFHNWNKFQPTKEAVDNERAAARARMRALRKARSEGKPFARTSGELQPNFGRSSQPPAPIYGSAVTEPVRGSPRPPETSSRSPNTYPGEGAAARHPSARPLAAALEDAGVNGKPATDDTVNAIVASLRQAITPPGDTT